MLEWITVKSFGLFCPYIDVFVRREALEGFKPAGEVIGLVRDHIFHGRQDARQSNGSVDIGALPGGDIQSQRSALHIVHGVGFGVAPAAADADGFIQEPPLFTAARAAMGFDMGAVDGRHFGLVRERPDNLAVQILPDPAL